MSTLSPVPQKTSKQARLIGVRLNLALIFIPLLTPAAAADLAWKYLSGA
jgi:hypothetical protein